MLRQLGTVLLEALVGFNIADKVAMWGRRVTGKLPPSFAPHAPPAPSCTPLSPAKPSARRSSWTPSTTATSSTPWVFPRANQSSIPFGLVHGTGEKLLRSTYATLVERMHEHRDPARMVQVQARARRDLPKSVVLEMMAVTPSASDRAVEAIEAYAAAPK